MIPVQELVALLGLPRFSLTRLALAFGLLIVAIGLGIAAFIVLVDALRLYLLLFLDPALVNLLVGLLLLLLAAGLCLIAQRLTRPRATAPRRARADQADVAGEALRWVQGHPYQAAVLAAVLGFCTGALPEARKALNELGKSQR